MKLKVLEGADSTGDNDLKASLWIADGKLCQETKQIVQILYDDADFGKMEDIFWERWVRRSSGMSA